MTGGNDEACGEHIEQTIDAVQPTCTYSKSSPNGLIFNH
jgi:hypothetical protein